MSLRRVCFAASLIASVLGIVATIEQWDRPLLWIFIAVGAIAVAGTVE
jgi:hypothetical protein